MLLGASGPSLTFPLSERFFISSVRTIVTRSLISSGQIAYPDHLDSQ